MRPKIQEKELKKDKENISKSISKLSKDRERDELLRKKHP